jgi:hypothetical protein
LSAFEAEVSHTAVVGRLERAEWCGRESGVSR